MCSYPRFEKTKNFPREGDSLGSQELKARNSKFFVGTSSLPTRINIDHSPSLRGGKRRDE
jgi:hypothetical protein